MVNWCCFSRSVVSDIETTSVEFKKPGTLKVPGYDKEIQFGVLVEFAYKIKDSQLEIVVATT